MIDRPAMRGLAVATWTEPAIAAAARELDAQPVPLVAAFAAVARATERLADVVDAHAAHRAMVRLLGRERK